MTPKEKAKELIEKFLPFANHSSLDRDMLWNHTGMEIKILNSKRCAIILCEEIVLNAKSVGNWIWSAEGKDELKTNAAYWQQVKTEIELWQL